MNLAEYRTLVGNRCQIGDTDPEFDKIAGYIAQAVRSYQTTARRGFDFLRRDVTLPTVADQRTYTFAAIGALVADNMPALVYPVRRVYTVGQALDNGQVRQLDRLSRYESDSEFGLGVVAAVPYRWTVEGRTLYIYPTPSEVADLALRVLLTDSIDPNDVASEPLLPDEYAEVIVQLSCSYVFQGIRDRLRMGDARAAYKDELGRLLTDVPWGGPGRPTLEPR